MVIIITGASHTGKTNLAQRMLEKYHYPYVSQDHIKMGLIRSGNTVLTPEDDDKLTAYLWPITREMIKTAIENQQNLIVEGCYCPFDWQDDFTADYLKEIRYICLCFTEAYITNHIAEIKAHASCIENRLDDDYCTPEMLKRDNSFYVNGCKAHGLAYVAVEEDYWGEIEKVLEEEEREERNHRNKFASDAKE